MAARASLLAFTIASVTAIELTIKYPRYTLSHLTGECAVGANCLLRECNEQNRVVLDGVEQEDTPDFAEYCDPYGTSWCEVAADGRFRAHQEVKDAHATNDACTAAGEWVTSEGTSIAACGVWGHETHCSTFDMPFPSPTRCEQYCGAAACAAILFGPCKQWGGSLQRYEECDPRPEECSSGWEECDPSREPSTMDLGQGAATVTEGLGLICADADTTTGASACVDYLDTFLSTTKIINFQPRLVRPLASLRNVCLFTQQCSGVCPAALCTDMIEGRCYDGNCVITDYGEACADGCVNFIDGRGRRQLTNMGIDNRPDNSEPGMVNVRQECDAHRTWTTFLIVIVVVGVVVLLGTVGGIVGCLFCCGCIKKRTARTSADAVTA